MDAYELKEYIKDNDKIKDILEPLGFHNFRSYGREYRCAKPNDNDNSQVSIKKDTLHCTIYQSDENFSGDIIDLVIYMKNIKFINAIIWMHEILDLKYEYGARSKSSKKNEHLSLMKSIRKKAKKYHSSDNMYSERVLDNFIEQPTLYLLKEQGITTKAQEVFNIHYDPTRQRVLYPYYDADNNNVLNGIMGRTTITGYEQLGIPKYYPIKKVSKTIGLFGLQQNRRHINSTGKIIIFEAENSVLKAWQMGYKNCVALGHHELKPDHIRKIMALNVNEVIIAFDKDISEEYILNKTVPVANKYFNVSYIKDEYDLLDEKDSPVDKSYKAWNFLYKNRIMVK